ncbi:MAG: antitoxin [Methylococcaceae bacterium]|nr:MAG: antitoxin [Methylococcaceae bacterium]
MQCIYDYLRMGPGKSFGQSEKTWDFFSYFKGMAEEAGVPYQSLINLYLRDCVAQHRKIQVSWPTEP